MGKDVIIACDFPSKEKTLAFVKTLKEFYEEKAKPYLFCGRMIPAPHVECEKINRNEKTALSHLLNDPVKRIIGFTVTYLIEKGKQIDSDMILAWNAMISEI